MGFGDTVFRAVGVAARLGVPVRALVRVVRDDGSTTTWDYDVDGNETEVSRLVPLDPSNVAKTTSRCGVEFGTVSVSAVTSTTLYDALGRIAATVDGRGNATRTEYDAYGRRVAAIDPAGARTSFAYDPATGRLATMIAAGGGAPFVWGYLPGSDLKSSLAYPSGLSASWDYDGCGRLTRVRNASATDVVSQYDYAYDAAGRRVSCAKSGTAFAVPDTCAYGYSARGELTNATAAADAAYRYGYDFDDIGNRKLSAERGTNCTYSANQLNQYASVGGFVPEYDADGNQTLVRTATGTWSVMYDAENRPIVWDNGSTNILMTYDRLCRRVSKNGDRFVYKDFLQVLHGNGSVLVWDPLEPGLTRPLVIVQGMRASYYTHDGNKNVSEIVSSDGGVSAHYAYDPYGGIDGMHSYDTGQVVNFMRFSSEYSDDEMGTVHYNFRALNPLYGRWIARDPGEELFSCNLYWYVGNQPVGHSDWLGLGDCRESNSDFTLNKTFAGLGGAIGSFTFSYHHSVWQKNCYVRCEDCSLGYTVERNVLDGGGSGMTWDLPIPGLPAVAKVPLSISYAMSGGEHYYYNSCTRKEKSEKCNSFSLTGSVGASVGVGRFMSYSVYGSLSYEWTDCGGESSRISAKITLEQCYFGQCWAADAFRWDMFEWK